MFILSERQVYDCFKKLMPYQAAQAQRYQKEKERNKIKVWMSDGTYALFTMKDNHTYIFEKKF